MNARSLAALAFGNFITATGMLVITGMLVEMADDLGRSIAVMGQLIAVAPLTMAIASPTLAMMTSRLSRRTLLVWGLMLSAVSQFLAALSGTLALLVVARMLTGLGIACFMPQAAATAVSLAPPGQSGRVLALVYIGFGAANTIGVPVGTWLGDVIGWRATVAIVGGLSLVGALWVRLALPASLPQSPLDRSSLRDIAHDRAILATLSVGFLQSAGQFVLFAYIAPSLRESIGATPATTGMLLAIFGAGGVLGSFVASRFADRLGPLRVILISMLLIIAAMLLWPLARGSFTLTAVAIAMWGLSAFPMGSSQQIRLMSLNPALATASVAFNNTATFSGAAVGAMLGGALISIAGYAILSWAGITFFLAALVMLRVSALASRGRSAAGRSSAGHSSGEQGGRD